MTLPFTESVRLDSPAKPYFAEKPVFAPDLHRKDKASSANQPILFCH
jgi:hypothetical protein